MRRRLPQDLTEGSIARHVVLLAVPAILSTLVHNLYGLNDVFFSKFTGLDGQTAVSNNLFVLITIFGFIQIAAIGTLTLVARRTGAGNEEGAGRAARQGLFFAAALSLVLGTIGFLTAPWVPQLMGMTSEVTALSVAYLRILFVGVPAMFLFPTVEAIYRARGDARTPLLLQVVAVATNIAGNATAVFVLGAGVPGIAVATILSRIVGVALGFLLLGRTGLDLTRGARGRLDLALWGRIAKVSAPVAVRTMLFGLIYQVVSRITAQFGAAAQNGLGVGIRVEGLCFFVLVGFGLAAGPMVGQNLGAGRADRAERAAWTTVGMAMVPALLFTALYLIWPRELMSLFAADAATVEYGTAYLRIIAACFVFLNLEVVLAHSFSGAGDTLPRCWWTCRSRPPASRSRGSSDATSAGEPRGSGGPSRPPRSFAASACPCSSRGGSGSAPGPIWTSRRPGVACPYRGQVQPVPCRHPSQQLRSGAQPPQPEPQPAPHEEPQPPRLDEHPVVRPSPPSISTTITRMVIRFMASPCRP